MTSKGGRLHSYSCQCTEVVQVRLPEQLDVMQNEGCVCGYDRLTWTNASYSDIAEMNALAAAIFGSSSLMSSSAC